MIEREFRIREGQTVHCLVAGENAKGIAIDAALLFHTPAYEKDNRCRTRITLLLDSLQDAEDFLFEYKELFDHSWYRMVRLDKEPVVSFIHRPKYSGERDDFVDVEWELVIGKLSNPLLQDKIERWSADPRQLLVILLCYAERGKNDRYADKLRRRLPDTVAVITDEENMAEKQRREKENLQLAKYLNYCYKVSFEQGAIPPELPEEEVEKAWVELSEPMRRSSIFNVMTIPFKMNLLGHSREDWKTFYALTAKEVDALTQVEHNRWVVERLIQGMRPCTDAENAEIKEDFRRREDVEYCKENPVTLKKRYAREKGVHFDLCSFNELGLDETGLPVTRYDRDLTEAIPLIVKTYTDRHG